MRLKRIQTEKNMRLKFKNGPLDGETMQSHDAMQVGQVVEQEYDTMGGKKKQPYKVASIEADVVNLTLVEPAKLKPAKPEQE